MGCELVRIEGKNVWCVFDNTLEDVKKFHDFESCVQGFRHFGRKLGVECSEDYVIEFFETVMAEAWEEEKLEEELKKIKEYFA